MRTYLTLIILALSLLMAGCANKPVEPFDQGNMPVLRPGMQRFMGISDDRCEDEWKAYQQAWERAMDQVARFASTRVVSKTVNWTKQETRQVILEKGVLGVQDIQTYWKEEASHNTNVTLRQVYESKYYLEQHRDGTWKARVILLANEEKLLSDARKALVKLEADVESARSNAECAVQTHKAQIREKMQDIEAEILLPQKLELLAKALEPYKQLQTTEASIQEARKAYAAGDGVLALVTYQEIPECIGDTPRDDSPILDVQHAYQEVWDAVHDAAGTLGTAQDYAEKQELMSAQNLLDEFHRRMGDAAGPFTHIETGETLSLSPLPSLLGKQLDALRQETEGAFQRGETALAAGDMVGAMQAYHDAVKANSEHPRAQQRLDQTLRMFATATLEANPAELTMTSRISIKENLSVSLKTSDGQSLPMPIAFRFEESGIDAEMVTDLLDNVSSTGTLTINKIRQSPTDTNKFHLLAIPSPQAMSNLDKMLISRLQSVLGKHIISIPVTLKPPSLAISLNLTSADMSQERMSEFRGNLEDKLRQKKYEIVEKSDVNTMEVRGELRMSSAPIGSIVALNMSITLAFWHDSRALEENVNISSGKQVDISEDEAFAAAQRIAIQKCADEIEKQMKKALSD